MGWRVLRGERNKDLEEVEIRIRSNESLTYMSVSKSKTLVIWQA